ncbi:uncharacterized protein LOC101462194 [Ceratitis capitata]|uniref:uncharacterized protein LOC101462194 n=1 Tax=Ceratitis capitata TaxID=7213 RepID=UPI000329F147|nr:uncharacterized protein LOC101462194 [Ceratitis capitata]
MTTTTDCTTQVYVYHSLGHQYSGNKSPDLQLTLHEYGKDSIELELTNLRYNTQKWQKIKHICILATLYLACITSVPKSLLLSKGLILCGVSCLLWLLYRILNLLSLIKSERIIFCLDLALQCHTVRIFSRTSNIFIPANNIYDIVINEVIEDLDVHYILIIRTQGQLFQKRPIIPLFNKLHPSFECLQMTYKYLNKILRKTGRLS